MKLSPDSPVRQLKQNSPLHLMPQANNDPKSISPPGLRGSRLGRLIAHVSPAAAQNEDSAVLETIS